MLGFAISSFLLPQQLTHPPLADSWTNPNKTAYNDGTLCNCADWGLEDPDCSNVNLATDCANNWVCVSETCEYPRGWTCGAGTYHDGVKCNCECGIFDPDCSTIADNTCTGTAAKYTCTTAGLCIEAACGNNYTDVLQLNEQCDGGVGCSALCQCADGYNPTTPPSLNCVPGAPCTVFLLVGAPLHSHTTLSFQNATTGS